MSKSRCDAKLADAPEACSGSMIDVWHGVIEPAIACGRHAKYELQAVFKGHDLRMKRDGTYDNRFGTAAEKSGDV